MRALKQLPAPTASRYDTTVMRSDERLLLVGLVAVHHRLVLPLTPALRVPVSAALAAAMTTMTPPSRRIITRLLITFYQ